METNMNKMNEMGYESCINCNNPGYKYPGAYMNPADTSQVPSDNMTEPAVMNDVAAPMATDYNMAEPSIMYNMTAPSTTEYITTTIPDDIPGPMVMDGVPSAPIATAPYDMGMGAYPQSKQFTAQQYASGNLANAIYVPGFLQKQIGKLMRVEFLIGGTVTERIGRLAEVGVDYIVLQLSEPATKIMCDLHSIKFASILDSNPCMYQPLS